MYKKNHTLSFLFTLAPFCIRSIHISTKPLALATCKAVFLFCVVFVKLVYKKSVWSGDINFQKHTML